MCVCVCVCVFDILCMFTTVGLFFFSVIPELRTQVGVKVGGSLHKYHMNDGVEVRSPVQLRHSKS